MVSIGIMVLVTTIVLVRQSNFNSAVLLENQAYEVAFDIRLVQTQTVSAQAGFTPSGDDVDFYSSYGIEFVSGSQTYTTFRVSESGTTAPYGAPLRLDPRFEIGEIREVQNGTENTLASVDIRFTRPNFDAVFTSQGSELSADEIVFIVRPRNDPSSTRRVEVTTAGQITVE